MNADFLIIGSGVIGVMQAAALHQRGLKVVVLDTASGPGQQTSYANAGQLSFDSSAPWAKPGLFQKVPGMLADPDGPLRIWPDISSFKGLYEQSKWIWWFTVNTATKRFKQNKRRILALSRFSAQCLHKQLHEYDLRFDHSQQGTLQLFRIDQRLFDSTLKNDLALLKESEISVEVLDSDGCIQQEPALSTIRNTIIGGLLFKDDETGDCFKFTSQIRKTLEEKGVEFLFNKKIMGIEAGNIAYGVRTDNNKFYQAKNIILCTGPFTRRLTDPLELVVPVYPVKGYSLTAEITDQNKDKAVRSTVLDERTKIAITRLGNRVRLGGTAEIAGFNNNICVRRIQVLIRTLEAVFPGCANLGYGAGVEPWSGLRPMTPDGTPIIGKTVIPNLYLNLGHGTLGFTQAAGSAELLAQIICNEALALDPTDYELGRYGRRYQNYGLYNQPLASSSI